MEKKTRKRVKVEKLNLQDIKTADNKFKFFMKWGWYKILTYFKPFIRPSFLVCFGIAWGFTNGWTYLTIALGVVYNKPTLVKVVSAWLAFLLFPTTCEGLITIPLALFLHSKLFKNDLITKSELDRMYKEAKHDAREVINKVRVKIDWYDYQKTIEQVNKKTARIKKRRDKRYEKIAHTIKNGSFKEAFLAFNDKRLDKLNAKLERKENKCLDKIYKKKYAKYTYDHYKEVEESVNTQNNDENSASKTREDESRVNTQQK